MSIRFVQAEYRRLNTEIKDVATSQFFDYEIYPWLVNYYFAYVNYVTFQLLCIRQSYIWIKTCIILPYELYSHSSIFQFSITLPRTFSPVTRIGIFEWINMNMNKYLKRNRQKDGLELQILILGVPLCFQKSVSIVVIFNMIFAHDSLIPTIFIPKATWYFKSLIIC